MLRVGEGVIDAGQQSQHRHHGHRQPPDRTRARPHRNCTGRWAGARKQHGRGQQQQNTADHPKKNLDPKADGAGATHQAGNAFNLANHGGLGADTTDHLNMLDRAAPSPIC